MKGVLKRLEMLRKEISPFLLMLTLRSFCSGCC